MQVPIHDTSKPRFSRKSDDQNVATFVFVGFLSLLMMHHRTGFGIPFHTYLEVPWVGFLPLKYGMEST
jgi:hypothetical protein